MWALPALGALMIVMLIQVEFDQDTPSSLNDFEGSSWLAEPIASSEWILALYTAVIFALALAVIEAGQRFRVTALVNAGVVVVAVLIMSIYIGRVAGELPTSIAVLLGGVLLVTGAVFLERKRRDLVAEVVS